MKIPRSRKQTAPRNAAARALRTSGLFRPKVEPATRKGPYIRRAKHPAPPRTTDDTDE